MTGPSPPTVPAPPGDPATPDGPAGTRGPAPPGPARTGLRRRLGWAGAGLLGALLLLLVLAVVAVSVPPTDRPPLDPSSVEPDGSRALVEVLRDRGVEVVTTRRFAEVRRRVAAAAADTAVGTTGGTTGGSTVLVIAPEWLYLDLSDQLAGLDGDLVLVAPGNAMIENLDRPVEAATLPRSGPEPPGCPEPAARAAGELDWEGWVYRPVPDLPWPATWCYPVPGGEGPTGRFVTWDGGGRRVALLGSSEPLRNDAVTRDGNAALALHVLGGHDTLLWWRVDPRDPALLDDTGVDEGPAAEPGLAPPWVGPMLFWLAVMGLLAMFWRGRRMGRLVAEPLPVLVRSAETAQGRAALYRQAGARERAAAILRADAVRRLASRLGLPASTPAAEVVSQAAARAGPDAAAVEQALAGPPPADAAALTRLADALDAVTDPAAGPDRSDAVAPAPTREPTTP